MAEERDIPIDQGMTSEEMETILMHMVKEGVLPVKEIIGWRHMYGEDFLTLNTSKIVVLTPFFYSGFGLPTSELLWD